MTPYLLQATVIPFRETHAIGAVDIAGTLVVVLMVLAAAFVLAAWMKRRGWLDRWLAKPVGASNPVGDLRVEQVLRLHGGTLVYRLSDGKSRYLLAQSGAGLQWLALPGGSDGENTDAR